MNWFILIYIKHKRLVFDFKPINLFLIYKIEYFIIMCNVSMDVLYKVLYENDYQKVILLKAFSTVLLGGTCHSVIRFLTT